MSDAPLVLDMAGQARATSERLGLPHVSDATPFLLQVYSAFPNQASHSDLNRASQNSVPLHEVST